MGVGFGDLGGGVVPVVHGGEGHDAEAVAVVGRDDDLLELSCEALARVADKLALHIVAPVDDKGEALVLGDGEGLDVAAQVVWRAVTVHAAAHIVMERRVGDGVDNEGSVALVLKGVARDQCRLGLGHPPLVYLFNVFRCKIDSTWHS